MQAPLAALGFLLGTGALWQSGHALWAMGALLSLANLPVTLIVIRPTNCLMATKIAISESRSLILKWGALHAIRTCLGVIATATFLFASLSS